MKNNIIFSMYQHSDCVILLIVISLLLISIVTWAFFFNKFLFLIKSKRLLYHDFFLLKKTSSVEEAILLLIKPKYFLSFSVVLLLKDVVSELYISWYMSARTSCSSSNMRDFVKTRIVMCLERRVVNIGNFIEKGNIFFSTVASISPFIGLFGTIWSITKYFLSFSSVQFMNFSIMSSGISESLVLTGLGLFVAIPALIMHNVFLHNIISYENTIDDCAAYLLLLLVRDLDSDVRVSHYTLLDIYQKCSLGSLDKENIS